MKISRKIINTIPVITYEKNDNKIKPALFFFHGFTGNKDTLMGRGEILAELGFYVIAFDAPLHGERKTEWFDRFSNAEKYQYIIDIEIKNAHEAKSIFESLKINEKIFKDYYFAYGVSMGAGVTFYLASIDKNLNSAVCLVGSPSFVEYYQGRAKQYNWGKDIIKDRLEVYKIKDPLINYLRLKDVNIWMGIGNQDNIVNPNYSRILHKKCTSSTILKEYNTGHESTPEMLNDSYEFLEKKIKDVEEKLNGKFKI